MLQLCQIANVHVFKIPARSTAGGHRAADWTEGIWEGRLQVIQKGKECNVILIDRNTGAEFARAPIEDGAVERCADSSRYFVLRCVNQLTKQRAFLGLAFSERNDAFEFNVALQDFDKFKANEASSQGHSLDISPPPQNYDHLCALYSFILMFRIMHETCITLLHSCFRVCLRMGFYFFVSVRAWVFFRGNFLIVFLTLFKSADLHSLS